MWLIWGAKYGDDRNWWKPEGKEEEWGGEGVL